MGLLQILHSLAPQNRWKISVAHFNHQLRGRASAADEKLVRRAAQKLGLPCLCERGDVAGFSRQAKISVEMAARKLRHEFLARVARAQEISVVALAHHADDQVELGFLRLLRGAGGEGLAGMKWRSPSPADKNVTLVRPLLGLTKAELRAFAREKKIRFRDDATNLSKDFLRNRIRHELLPLLRQKYQPGLDKTVLRLMDIVGAEAEFAGGTARQWLENQNGKRQAESGNRPAPPHGTPGSFNQLPVAVQRKVLQQQLAERGVAADFELIEQLRAAAGKYVSVGSGWSVARAATGTITLREQVANQFDADECRVKLTGRAGRADFGGQRIRWASRPLKKFRPPQKKAGAEVFDADKIGGEITLRHWRAGDRFQPIGLATSAKLQDLFVNAKIPAARRHGLVVAATADGEIFWVEGLRVGERFKLTPATKRTLGWHWSQLSA